MLLEVLRSTPFFLIRRNLTTTKRPIWVQQILDDKRTYFDNVSDVERCFLTNVSRHDDNSYFSLSFDNAPKPANRRIDTSFYSLRESCRCSKCFANNAQQKYNNYCHICNLDINDSPVHSEFDRDNQLLHVTWASDGHQSTYAGPWLYSTFNRHPLMEKPKKKLWTAKEYMKSSKKHDFHDVCSHPKSMLNCLMDVATHGLATIVNAPTETGTLAKLSQNINYCKRTHYGTFFRVENKAVETNTAYNPDVIKSHVDLPYFEYVPGTQFLHCIRQSKTGGGNMFADGFAVAGYLRQNERDFFETLTKTIATTYSYTSDDSDCFLVNNLPLISLSLDKHSVTRINYNDGVRDSLRHSTLAQQRSFFKAYKRFVELLDSPQFRLDVKMNEGDIALFDNTRLIHAREAFPASESRLLEGCYIDWDEVYSRIRLLKSSIFRKALAERWPEN